MKEIRIAYTGGGSGGHINPLLSVAEECKKIASTRQDFDFKFYYFGNPEIYAESFTALDIQVVKTIHFKIRRYFSPQNIIDFFKLPFAFIEAFWKMFKIMPNVLFSKGGTGAFPIVFAAWFFRIPIFVHESDSIPGKTNKLSFGMAKRIALSFSKSLDFINGPKVAVVGNPIRKFLLEEESDLNQEKAKKILGFDPQLPLILVIGGSLGSVRINDFMMENIKSFVSKYQVLHQAGINNFQELKTELAVAAKNFLPEERSRYKIIDFFKKDMKEAYMACDLVISRAGSGSIFEIAYFKKPSILIPLKESAQNHQYFNAYEYARRGGAIVIEEDNLKSSIFFTQLDSILSNRNKYDEMISKIGDFARPQSAAVIADEIINLALK